MNDDFKLLLDHVPSMVWRANATAHYDYFNNSWCEFTGRTLEQEQGEGWLEGVHLQDRKHCVRVFQEAFKNCKPFKREFRLCRADGDFRWIRDHGTPVVKDGTLIGFVGSCMELPSNSILYDVARKKQSSGMLSRFAMEQLVHTYVERGKTQNSPLSLMIFDLDNFKKFAHAYGEEAGEIAIGLITEAVKGSLRNSDALGVLNKNQFVIVMPNTELKDTLAIADRLRKMIASLLMDVGGLPVRITASFGVTQWRGTEIDLLWANMHKALQEAKQRGKNCVSKYP